MINILTKFFKELYNFWDKQPAPIETSSAVGVSGSLFVDNSILTTTGPLLQ